jgi:hypothetical protein
MSAQQPVPQASAAVVTHAKLRLRVFLVCVCVCVSVRLCVCLSIVCMCCPCALQCNIGVNGTDGHGNQCADGTYCCFCSAPGGGRHSRPIPCNATVGLENVLENFASGSHSSCTSASHDYDCFRTNAAKKFTNSTPGWWYSSLKQGYCGDHPGSGSAPNCTWKVQKVEKRVTQACRNDVFFGAVEDVDKTCFETCPKGPGLGRNTTDACWIRCFYKAVLGPGGAKPINGSDTAGIPLDSLVQMWAKAFEDESAGGCKPL